MGRILTHFWKTTMRRTGMSNNYSLHPSILNMYTQRRYQSRHGGRFTNRQNEFDGQVCGGQFRWGLYSDAGYDSSLNPPPGINSYAYTLLGVNFMEKTISVRRTTITFSIWDLGGQREFVNMLPLVCNDAVAILFMFDLSRKSTLNSVKEWYRQARGFNKVGFFH